MQCSRKKLLIKNLLFFCNFWALFPIQAAVHYDPTAIQQLGQLATEWINQFGQSAVVLNPPISKYDLFSGYGELLLPLHQRKQQLLLTQLGLQHDSLQTTYNIGVGQRHLTRSPGYWGYNLFYDYHGQGSHSRLGLGLEWHGVQGIIRLNGYLPLSNWHSDTENTLQSRPAEGIDLQLQRTICQQPYLRAQLLLAHYFSRSLVQKTEQQSSPKASTATIGIDYAPIPLFSAGYGFQISNGGLRTHQVQFSLIYRLGVPLVQQFDPHQITNAYSLNNSHFELIKRQAQMVLQQRAAPVASAAESGESGVTETSEEPKIISQVSTPEPQSDPPEQVIPDQGPTSSTIASQPDSIASGDNELHQHSTWSDLSEIMPTVSSTTASCEALPVNRRDDNKPYKIITKNTEEFVNTNLNKYKAKFEKYKNKNQESSASSEPEFIDLNHIDYKTLANVNNMDKVTFSHIIFTQKTTNKNGTIQQYKEGLFLLNSLNQVTEFKGINYCSLDEKTKAKLIVK